MRKEKFSEIHKKILWTSVCILVVLAFTGLFGEVETSKNSIPVEVVQQENIKDQKDETLTKVAYEQSEIHFIDTGNSDAILIINDDEAMLVDGGDNDDEKLIVNYLKKQGISELKYVIATHPHADHIGGLDAVIESYKIKHLFVANGDSETKTYKDFIEAAMNKGLSPSVPLEEKKFYLGTSYFTVLNTEGAHDTNNQSLVVTYVNGDDKILLMGDAEAEVESKILRQVGDVDLLKLGHHGSRSSTTQAFLNKVDPEYGIITCGAGNKYGHPHQETVSKLEGIEVHRSDECGDIIFTSTGQGLTTDCKVGSYMAGKKK